MTSQEFSGLRHFLGKSQSRFADLLGISIRSVQAYEQGWREVPSQVQRMALYLLYQKLVGRKPVKPCWELKGCPNQWRKRCPAWEFQAQGPCWFLNGTLCEGKNIATWQEKMDTCQSCSVFTELMQHGEDSERE